MTTIAINYVLSKNLTKEILERILSGCCSDKFEILLNFFDFSIDKKNKELINELSKKYSSIKISIYDQDYENLKDANNMILKDCIRFAESTAMCILNDQFIINNIILDNIDFDILREEFNGFIYCDYTINDIRCFLTSHIAGISIGMPTMFLSTEKVLKHLSEDNIFSYLFSSYAGIHIPEVLFSVYPNEI